MTYGMEIYLSQLNSIEIAADGQTVKVGGGVISRNLTDALWAARKQTGELAYSSVMPQSKDLHLDSHWNLRVR